MSSAYIRLTITFLGIGLLAGCEEERVPRSTNEFLENPIMLEAAIVRCSRDRSATRYDAECVNARQAIRSIEAEKEAAQRIEHDARSQSKRQALRRAQEAAAQARRRSAESERLRKEAEYLAQFGVPLPVENRETAESVDFGNTPLAVVPESSEPELSSRSGDAVQATDGGNAPGSGSVPEEDDSKSDLASIRDELQRRNDDSGD